MGSPDGEAPFHLRKLEFERREQYLIRQQRFYFNYNRGDIMTEFERQADDFIKNEQQFHLGFLPSNPIR